MATREEELERLRYLELKRKASQVSPIREDIGLPGKTRTEQLIQKRTPATETLAKETMQPWEFGKHPIKTTIGAIPRILTTGLKTLAVPIERGEAAIANPLMRLQEIDKTKDISALGLPSISLTKELAGESLKGLTGERRGQIGDVPRRAGFPEPVSATIGLGSMIALTDILTGGVITKKGKLPSVQGKDFTLDKAQKAVNLLDDTRSTLGKAVGSSIDDVANVGLAPDDIVKISIKTKKLPTNVLNAIDDPMYGIEKLPDGSIKPTVANMNKIKHMLDDFVTSKAWKESTRMSQTIVKDLYRTVNQGMKDAAKSAGKPIDKALDTFSKFKDLYDDIMPKLAKRGTTVEKPLRGIFKPGGERAYRVMWEKMQKYIPEFKQIAKDMESFTRRQGIKSTLGKEARLLGRIGILGTAFGRGLFNKAND